MMDLMYLRKQIIGNGSLITTPYGNRILTYADYTASGRSLKFLEEYMLTLEEYYANTHTEDTFTGAQMTKLYHQAKDMIRSLLGASNEYIVVSTGSGATAAIHKLTQILGIYEAPAKKARHDQLLNELALSLPENEKTIHLIQETNLKKRPVVFITAYEHHSNVLPWREGDAEVVEINLTPDGKMDLVELESHLQRECYSNRLKIGSFSAASNVTGMISPIEELTDLMHEYGGYVFFDYAACAPYLEIILKRDESHYIDGVFISQHKFLGGPGCSGLLIFHEKIYQELLAPTCAGGGTVQYVNHNTHDFKTNIEEREDAGTPAILQTIKAALVLQIKKNIGYQKIENIENDYLERAHQLLMIHPQIELIGKENDSKYINILSFNVLYLEGYLHPRFIIKLLNDLFGIQGRAGCSCAGPYGHRLLGINDELSSGYREVILGGHESMKPGWVRLNFHFSIDEETFLFIIQAILFVASYGYMFLEDYEVNHTTGLWAHKNQGVVKYRELNVNELWSMHKPAESENIAYDHYFEYANKILENKNPMTISLKKYGFERWPQLSWFYLSEK